MMSSDPDEAAGQFRPQGAHPTLVHLQTRCLGAEPGWLDETSLPTLWFFSLDLVSVDRSEGLPVAGPSKVFHRCPTGLS